MLRQKKNQEDRVQRNPGPGGGGTGNGGGLQPATKTAKKKKDSAGGTRLGGRGRLPVVVASLKVSLVLG